MSPNKEPWQQREDHFILKTNYKREIILPVLTCSLTFLLFQSTGQVFVPVVHKAYALYSIKLLRFNIIMTQSTKNSTKTAIYISRVSHSSLENIVLSSKGCYYMDIFHHIDNDTTHIYIITTTLQIGNYMQVKFRDKVNKYLMTNGRVLRMSVTLICSSTAVATLVCISTRRFFSSSSGRELYMKTTSSYM